MSATPAPTTPPATQDTRYYEFYPRTKSWGGHAIDLITCKDGGLTCANAGYALLGVAELVATLVIAVFETCTTTLYNGLACVYYGAVNLVCGEELEDSEPEAAGTPTKAPAPPAISKAAQIAAKEQQERTLQTEFDRLSAVATTAAAGVAPLDIALADAVGALNTDSEQKAKAFALRQQTNTAKGAGFLGTVGLIAGTVSKYVFGTTVAVPVALGGAALGALGGAFNAQNTLPGKVAAQPEPIDPMLIAGVGTATARRDAATTAAAAAQTAVNAARVQLDAVRAELTALRA